MHDANAFYCGGSMTRLLYVFRHILGVLIFVGLLTSCDGAGLDGSGTNSVSKSEEPTEFALQVFNHSQFALHHLFIHQTIEDYRDAPSFIEEPLVPGDFFVVFLPANRRYRVTVTRVKNKWRWYL